MHERPLTAERLTDHSRARIVRALLVIGLICVLASGACGAPPVPERANLSDPDGDWPLLVANYYIWYRDNRPNGE